MRRYVSLLVVMVALAACATGGRGRGSGDRDRVTLRDGGPEAGADAGRPDDRDARVGRDAAPDAGRMEAGPDAIVLPEGGSEGGVDARPPDAAGPDGMAPRCNIGNACDPTSGAGCTGGNECQAPVPVGTRTVVDTAGNPTGDSFESTLFQGGYCMPRTVADPITRRGREACDPDASSDPCGDCASCTRLGPGVAACLRNCSFNLENNDVCRDGYACTTGDFCLDGCSSDIECQVYSADLDGDGTEETVFDPALSGATCNMGTYRCETPGAPGAEAGDVCTRDSQCEADGRCLDEDTYDWPGGYCTKFRCDVEGNGCAGGGKCQERGIGLHICVQACTVGADAAGNPVDPAAPASWRTATGGCRSGYLCWWDGTGRGADNGGCVPGNFNAVTTANVGAACAGDEQCWSPFGLGRCLETGLSGADARGYCTVLDCAAAGLPAGVCGAGAECVTGVVAEDPAFGICLRPCTTGRDCGPNATCLEDSDGTGRHCVPGNACRADADCSVAGQRCVGATADSDGTCS